MAAGPNTLQIPGKVEMQHHTLDFAIDSADLRFTPQPNDIRDCVLNFIINASRAVSLWRGPPTLSRRSTIMS